MATAFQKSSTLVHIGFGATPDGFLCSTCADRFVTVAAGSDTGDAVLLMLVSSRRGMARDTLWSRRNLATSSGAKSEDGDCTNSSVACHFGLKQVRRHHRAFRSLFLYDEA
jgi:hypothetical protein